MECRMITLYNYEDFTALTIDKTDVETLNNYYVKKYFMTFEYTLTKYNTQYLSNVFGTEITNNFWVGPSMFSKIKDVLKQEKINNVVESVLK